MHAFSFTIFCHFLHYPTLSVSKKIQPEAKKVQMCRSILAKKHQKLCYVAFNSEATKIFKSIYLIFIFHKVLYLGFEKWEDQIVLDESDKGNNAFLNNGAFIAPHRGACGHFASLAKSGDILLEDTTFRGKPRTGVTVAIWVNLPGTSRGIHSVFSTARVMRIGQIMGKNRYNFLPGFFYQACYVMDMVMCRMLTKKFFICAHYRKVKQQHKLIKQFVSAKKYIAT